MLFPHPPQLMIEIVETTETEIATAAAEVEAVAKANTHQNLTYLAAV